MSARDRLAAAWQELEADALASDGRITDRDVKDAIKRNRPRIEDAVAGAGLIEQARLVSQWGDAVDMMPDELRFELRELALAVQATKEALA